MPRNTGEVSLMLVAQVVALASVVASGVVFVVTIQGDIRELEARHAGEITILSTKIESQGKVQEERDKSILRRIEALEKKVDE